MSEVAFGSPITYTLECGEPAISERAKYTGTADNGTYGTYPDWVKFQISGVQRAHDGRNGLTTEATVKVMVTSTWPNGTKFTETISAESARHRWKRWVDKGYKRALTNP